MRFDTQQIHAGFEPGGTQNPQTCTVPLYMTNAYPFENSEHARSLFQLEQSGHMYTRLSNPTTDVLEQRMTALEGGVGALGAASGHAAMTMAFFNLVTQPGDEIISSRAIYGGAVNLMGKTMGMMGLGVRFVDGDDPQAFENAVTDRTRAIFVESLSNPRSDVPDLAAIAQVAKRVGVPFIVDNTVATSALLRPIEHGADIVVYSTTKYIAGNGTNMGGMVIDAGTFAWKDNPRFPGFNNPDASYHGLVYADAFGKSAFIVKLRAHMLRDLGGVMSPFNAWLTLLGMETLSMRMKRHSESALRIAQYLQKHPRVENVSFPGLPESPYYALAQKYLPKGQSSMFTFDMKEGREAAAKVCDSLKLFTIVTNLGDSRSLANSPAATTHSQLTDDQLKAAGISPGTVRLSVGLEDVEDLLEDLEQALEK